MRRLVFALTISLAACRAPSHPPISPGTAPVTSAPSGPAIDRVELPPLEKRIDVPGFAGAAAWLNVDHPITMSELKGRVVIVDFWTSCCINCLHTIPTLQAIEARFAGQPVTVIGVHSPKFDEERGVARLVDFVNDNRIRHPIAVDSEMKVWHAWGVDGWPTVAVLDVEGRAVWIGSGEPERAELEGVIASALDEGKKSGRLARGELSGVRRERDPSGPLKYPGKVLPLADGGLAIADTGHDRIAIVDKNGKLVDAVGSGLEGKLDGSFDQASFKRPEGMTEYDGSIYVADTGNHLLRRIDRRARNVTTVAGTGEIGERRLESEEKKATDVGLRSPWDVLAIGDTIYVALAGSHQIGAFDPRRGTVRMFAGNGVEQIHDGSWENAMFAQPSALATNGKTLFVLDSETSSVRAIDLAKRDVTTIVGEGLFVFGDVDGDRHVARLQHPIGLAYDGGFLWVADTYNSKVKKIDPKTGDVKTFAGNGDLLREPAGIAAKDGVLFVADTDHHRILRFGFPLPVPQPLAIEGLSAPAEGVAVAAASKVPTIDPRDPIARIGAFAIGGGKTTIAVSFRVPSGTGINERAGVRLAWVEARGLARTPATLRATGADVKDGFAIEVEPAENARAATLEGVLDMVICDVATHAVCVPVRRTVTATFAIDAQNPSRGAGTIELPAAR